MNQEKIELKKSNNLIFEKALKNCHVVGLHGIVFKETDGYLTRMFVATSNHVLNENSCEGNEESWKPLSLAIHPHRIDIEIHVKTGTIYNMEFEKV